MKTFTKFLASLVLAVVMLPAVASAQLVVSQGGTGLTSVAANNIPYGVSASLRLGSESAFTYNPSTNLFTTTYASTTGISGTNGDLSNLSVTTLCIGGDCKTAWPSGGSGGTDVNWTALASSYLRPATTTYGISVLASSTIGGGTGATGLTVNGTATSTDLVVRNLTSALTLTDGQGLFAEYAGTTCTNQFVRVLSALGVATCATVDISSDTNLTADGTEIVLTGDALSLGTALTFTTGTSSTSFQTALLGVGTDYISDITGTGIINTGGALQASLGTSISAAEMADGDNGFFTYTTGVAAVDANAWTSANLASYLSDETGTAGSAVFSANPTFTGLTTHANYFATNGSTTNATSTALAVTTTFNFLGTIITNIATWFSTTLNAVSSFVAAGSSTWDFGGATSVEIPNGTGPTISATGQLALDTTDMQVLVGTSTSANPGVLRTIDTIHKFKVPSTSPMFATSTTTYFPTEEDGYTVTDIFCSVEGGTSKIITLFGESVTCDNDGQADDGAITINTIAAASTTVPFTASTTSGVVNWLNVSVKGKWTRE